MLRHKIMQAIYKDDTSCTISGWRYIILLKPTGSYISFEHGLYLEMVPDAPDGSRVDIFICTDSGRRHKISWVRYYRDRDEFGNPHIPNLDSLMELMREWGFSPPYTWAKKIIQNISETLYY